MLWPKWIGGAVAYILKYCWVFLAFGTLNVFAETDSPVEGIQFLLQSHPSLQDDIETLEWLGPWKRYPRSFRRGASDQAKTESVQRMGDISLKITSLDYEDADISVVFKLRSIEDAQDPRAVQAYFMLSKALEMAKRAERARYDDVALLAPKIRVGQRGGVSMVYELSGTAEWTDQQANLAIRFAEFALKFFHSTPLFRDWKPRNGEGVLLVGGSLIYFRKLEWPGSKRFVEVQFESSFAQRFWIGESLGAECASLLGSFDNFRRMLLGRWGISVNTAAAFRIEVPRKEIDEVAWAKGIFSEALRSLQLH